LAVLVAFVGCIEVYTRLVAAARDVALYPCALKVASAMGRMLTLKFALGSVFAFLGWRLGAKSGEYLVFTVCVQLRCFMQYSSVTGAGRWLIRHCATLSFGFRRGGVGRGWSWRAYEADGVLAALVITAFVTQRPAVAMNAFVVLLLALGLYGPLLHVLQAVSYILQPMHRPMPEVMTGTRTVPALQLTAQCTHWRWCCGCGEFCRVPGTDVDAALRRVL
jgi:hypothetical protein